MPPSTVLSSRATSMNEKSDEQAERINTNNSGNLGEQSNAPRNIESQISHLQNWPRGWRPWFCLAGCFFLMFNSWGLVNAYGTFQSYYDQHLLRGTSILLLNLVGASECFFVLLLSFAMGRLLDAGFAKHLLPVGTVLVTLGMFLLGLVNRGTSPGGGSYGLTYLTQGFLMSVGMGCFFIASSQIAATWFQKRKTAVVGIVACGASIAGLIYPVMTKELIRRIGFENAEYCAAGLAVATCFFSCVFATPNPDYPLRKPERWLSSETWIDPHAFRNSAYCWFVAAICFMFFGFYPIFFNLEEWAAQNGFGYKDAVPGAFEDVTTPDTEVPRDAIRTFYLLAIMNVSSSIGRIAGGFFGQFHGTLIAHGVVMFVASIFCLCFWPFVPNARAAIAFVVLFGAFSGAVIGLPPASVFSIADLDPNADKSRLGQWTGMMYTCAAIPALVGPVIGGQLVKSSGFLGLEMFCGTCLLISSFCIAMAHMNAEHGSAKAAVAKYKLSTSNLASRVTLGMSETRSKRGTSTRTTTAQNTPWASPSPSDSERSRSQTDVRGG